MTLDPRHSTAAACLSGLHLPNGWIVRDYIQRPSCQTGGHFSHSYIVEKDGKRGFLKAFDFARAFEPHVDTIAILRHLTSDYEHEREILEICKERRLSQVVIAIDHGIVHVPNMTRMEGQVHYLIFELADGDVRRQVTEGRLFNTLWSMRALKDVSLGLWQVHKEMIAHQDIKPSNVLVFADVKGFRIADFGRSSRKGSAASHDEYKVAGDRTYSPPELLYGHISTDFVARRCGCDIYMLGNLASFMFTGVNVTATMLAKLDPQFHCREWQGSYAQILPYLQGAFAEVLQTLEPHIDPIVAPDILRTIQQLCNPDPDLRGHPKGLGRTGQYSLERYVSQFELLCKRLEVRVRRRCTFP